MDPRTDLLIFLTNNDTITSACEIYQFISLLTQRFQAKVDISHKTDPPNQLPIFAIHTSKIAPAQALLLKDPA
jgi:hypothetical protein